MALLLSRFKRIKLVYDPAQLVAQRKLDPFVKYWSLLKSSVAYIDVHDYQSGGSAKVAGYGDAQLDLTISDALATNFNGWYCIEPGLGKRHGTAQSKEDVFLRALTAFRELLTRTSMQKVL